MKNCLLALVIGVLAACASKPADIAADHNPNAVPLMKMATSDHMVTIHLHARESLFTVEDKAGRLLVSQVRMEELEAKYPEMHRVVKNAVAKIDASNKHSREPSSKENLMMETN